MDDQRDSAWADAMLRRPAVDPGIPGPERALLTAPGTLLTPACHARPARNRDYLPTDPDKRGATIDGAVMGMTAAAFIAVGGATPLAIGTLIFSDPVGWQSASGHYGLLLAEILAIITAVVFVTRVVRFGQPGGRAPADVAARTYHGRYLTAADFDARSRVLLRRTQDAVDGVTSAEVYQADLLDAPATGLALAGQEWDIALALREQARLRARRAEVPADGGGPQTAAVLDHQVQAARLADASIAARVARFGQPGGRAPADVAARTYHGRYLTAADFDARSRVLLRRTQDAVDGVTSAEIYRVGLLDAPATGLALAGQEWDIALALREQARLRARRAEVPADGAGPQTAAVLDYQVQAARLADASIAARVAALEGYAAEVREADAAYRDWRQAAALAEVSRQHLDMLARTAADEHGIAEIDTMTRQARAIRQAFREPPG